MCLLKQRMLTQRLASDNASLKCSQRSALISKKAIVSLVFMGLPLLAQNGYSSNWKSENFILICPCTRLNDATKSSVSSLAWLIKRHKPFLLPLLCRCFGEVFDKSIRPIHSPITAVAIKQKRTMVIPSSTNRCVPVSDFVHLLQFILE